MSMKSGSWNGNGQSTRQPAAEIARAIAEASKMLRGDTPPTIPQVVQPSQKKIDVELQKFLELNPPTFRGGLSLVETEEWINNIEAIFHVMDCPQSRKVDLAIFLFEGEAKRQWDDLMVRKFAARKEPKVTWSEFVHQFTCWFVPPAEKWRLHEKYVNLVQGDRTVAEYMAEFEAEFPKLDYYLRLWIASEEYQCFLFQQGLRDDIRCYLEPFNILDFATLVDMARKFEIYQERELMRKMEFESVIQAPGPQGRKKKNKAKMSQPSGSSSAVHTILPKCDRCGNVHKGQCLTGTSICYLCHQTGHRQHQCPRKAVGR